MTAGNKSQIARGESNLKERQRNLTVWVTLFFLLVWGVFTHSHVSSANDRSRIAATESLVHRGTWVIDESAFSRTVDRIFVKGHFYSDKPPVLTLIASGVYAVLHHGLDLSLDTAWCDLDQSPCHCRVFCESKPDRAYYLLTLVLVGLPSALMLALFYHIASRFGLDNPAALLLTTALGLATQVFPYSTVFNSHLPAAASLLGGFYALLRAQEGSHTPRWLFGAGFLTALASTFDLGTGLFLLAFASYAAWGHRRRAWPYFLGALLPLALMAFLDVQITGNPLPPYTYTPGYDYPGSRFPQTVAGNRSPDNVLRYGLRLLLGDHGLFAFSPVLLWAVVALALSWRKRALPAAGLVGLTSGAFALYFILFTDNFGGAAYGPRWYTVFVPLLFVFVAGQWRAMRTPARTALFVALAALSFANSFQGALNPWREATPLLQIEYTPPTPKETVEVALSGVAYEDINPDLLATWSTRRVNKRWFDARLCLVIPPGPVWLFSDVSLDPALAALSGLTDERGQTRYLDLQPTFDARLERMSRAAWISPALSPSESDPSTPLPLPASFGPLTLSGYELLDGEREPGAEITLITAWQVQERPEPPLSIFVHLLDPQGGLRGQFDGLGANPDSLRVGDVLLHVHRFTIAPDAPPGRYWLQLGLYNPQTMARLPVLGQESERLLLTWIDLND
jgi:hypothetical protein